VTIDASRSVHIDYDVYEIIRDFEEKAKLKDIELTVKGLASMYIENNAVRKVKRVIRREKKRSALFATADLEN
jgi:hypothetical protein